MQYLGIEYLTWTGKYSKAIRQVPIAFNIATQLMRSSFPGEVGRAGYFHLHHVFFAAAELADHVGVGQCDVLGPLIGEVENAVPEPADYVRAQLLQFCASVLSAVQECPPTTEASELVRYFHEHEHLRAVLYDWSDEDEYGPGASGTETLERRHPSPEDGKRLRLVANRLLEGHRFPFDKAATIAELPDALAIPWSRLDMKPRDMRQLCMTRTRGGFYSGVHDAFAAVMMGSTCIGTREWRELEANASTARRILSDVPNPIGKAIVIEVTRVFFQQLEAIMGCWYNLRLVQEVTRSLIGIKTFALRNGTLPSTMSDVVATEILGSLPEDPFSQTPLEYMPHRKLVRISPSTDEIKEWLPALRNLTWRLLKWSQWDAGVKEGAGHHR